MKSTEATLEGIVKPNGELTECHFQYGLTTVPVTEHAVPCSPELLTGFGEQEIGPKKTNEKGELLPAPITELTPDAPYHYRIVTKNGKGEEATGPEKEFKRVLAPPEEPKTEAAEAITNTTAQLRGSVNPTTPSNVSWYFEYNKGITCKGGTRTPTQPEQGPEEVQARPAEAQITGLQAATTYTVCLVAENEAHETTVGNEVAITTLALKPTVSEESFSTVTSSEATVSAQVNAEGISTTYKVEYGTSEPYASSGETSLPAAEGAVGIVAHLGGLTPGTEYHFRIIATNTFGSTQGPATPFTTASNSTSSQVLPDGRAYEMASPPDAHDVFLPETTNLVLALGGAKNLASYLPFRASADGEAVAYEGSAPSTNGNGFELPGGTGNAVISLRAVHGWTGADITPAPLGKRETTQEETYQTFSSDLSFGIESSTEDSGGKSLVAGASACDSLYARTSADGVFHPFFTTTPNPIPASCGYGEVFAGASADGSHLLFETPSALTPQAEPAEGEGRENLYESINGELATVNVLDGKAAPNATFGSNFGQFEGGTSKFSGADFSNTISSDGSRIFWTDLDTNRIYMREDGATTVAVSTGEAHYWTATPDGRFVFYTEGGRLWRLDVESATREALTPAGAQAKVQGVIGASADGTYVYFVAGGALADGVAPRVCKKIELQEVEVQEQFEHGLISEQEEQTALQELAKEKAEEGEGATPPRTGCTLYVRHEDQTKRIATLAPTDDRLSVHDPTTAEYGDWQPSLGARTAEVTSDGHAIVFESSRSLTGNDNIVLHRNGEVPPAIEAFVYNVADERLSCASCNPSGVAPVLTRATEEGEGVLPGSAIGNTTSTYMLRWISEDGNRVFFESDQALVPQDTNGQADVYEWEKEGLESCPSKVPARKDSGCVFLLGAGSGKSGSMFVDASASGDDVFFATRAKLLPQDRNENMKLYDARIGGGFPEPSLACTGTGCQGVPPAPPQFATPSSAMFSGIGNFPAPAPVRPKFASQSRTEKLAKALKTCRTKHDRHKRSVCEASARKKYGVATKKSKRAGNRQRTK